MVAANRGPHRLPPLLPAGVEQPPRRRTLASVGTAVVAANRGVSARASTRRSQTGTQSTVANYRLARALEISPSCDLGRGEPASGCSQTSPQVGKRARRWANQARLPDLHGQAVPGHDFTKRTSVYGYDTSYDTNTLASFETSQRESSFSRLPLPRAWRRL